MPDWEQDYVCWKCRDRIVCPKDALWSWPRSVEVRAFEAKHAACERVGLTLTIFPDEVVIGTI